MSIESPWLTVRQGAEYSRRHKNTLLTALRNGELQGSQTKRNGSWLIHRDALDAWIRGEVAEVQVPRIAGGKRQSAGESAAVAG